MTTTRERILAPAWMSLLLATGVLLAAAFAAGCARSEASAAPATAEAAAEDDASSPVRRGEYLVTVAGCNDCHTPWHLGPNGPEPDMSRMLSGHPQDAVVTAPPAPAGGPWIVAAHATNTAWAGPWGVSFTANLTPDESTGIGVWSEEIFIETLRTGKHWGQSRPILPPMPWFNYGKMTDEDLRAIYAYLRTIPPIENRVPEPLPPAAESAG